MPCEFMTSKKSSGKKRGRPLGSRNRRPNRRLFLDVQALQERYRCTYWSALKYVRQRGFPPKVDGHYWWHRADVAAFDKGKRWPAPPGPAEQ